MPKTENELNDTNKPNLSFEDVEKEQKLKEEREKNYKDSVDSKVTYTAMINGKFDRRRYTRKAELSQLVAAWRKELEADPEVLKDEKLEKILKDVEAYVMMDITATHSVDMEKREDTEISFWGTRSGVKKETRKVSEIFEDVKNYIEEYEREQYKVLGKEEEALLAKRQIMAGNIHLFLEDQMNGFLPEVPKGAKHIKAKDNMKVAQAFDRLWDHRDEPLFSHDPSPSDVSQGYLGDCYMVALLANVASKDPDMIKEAIRDNGDGSVTVRLFQRIPKDLLSTSVKEEDKYEPFYVTVDKTAPMVAGAHNNLWVAMIEKAMVASGVSVDKDQCGVYARPVPENIDELYDKYKDMPEYLRPSRVECPWLYNEKNKFVPWQPKYKDIVGGMSEEFGEMFLGPKYQASKDMIFNSRNNAGKDIVYNYIMKLLEKESSKRFADDVKSLLNTQEKTENRLNNAIEIYQAVKTKKVNHFTYKPKLNSRGTLDGLGYLSGSGYKLFAEELSNGIGEMLFECNLSDKKIDELINDTEQKVTAKLQEKKSATTGKKLTAEEITQVDSMLEVFGNEKMSLAEDFKGGKYPQSYLEKYKEMKKALEEGKIVSASSPSSQKGDRKVNGGINYQHAYNVLGVTEETVGEKTYKFLYIRNPHGGSLVPEYDFTGIPPRVTDGYDVKSEGIFKMELSHFMNNMSSINYNGKELTKEQATEISEKRINVTHALLVNKYEKLFTIINRDLIEALKKEKISESRQKILTEGMKGLAGKYGEKPKIHECFSSVKAVTDEILRNEKISAETTRILKCNKKILGLFYSGVEDPVSVLGEDKVSATLPTNRSLYDFIDIGEQNEFTAGIKTAIGEGTHLLKMLKDVDPWLMTSSKQFKNMMKKVKVFGDTFKDLKNEPREEKMEEYIKSLKELAVASKQYLDFKTEARTQKDGSIQYKSDLERKRVYAAKKIMDYAVEKSRSMEKTYVQSSLAVKFHKAMFPEQEINIQDFKVRNTVKSKAFQEVIAGKTTADLKKILLDEGSMKKLTAAFKEERSTSVQHYIKEIAGEYEQVFDNGLSTEEEKTNAAARYVYGFILQKVGASDKYSEQAVRAMEKEYTDFIKKQNSFISFTKSINTLTNNEQRLKDIDSEFHLNLNYEKHENMRVRLMSKTKEINAREAELQKEETLKKQSTKDASNNIAVEDNQKEAENERMF